jgi:hypothetical protein
MLVRLGYALAIIYKRDRTRYLNALRAADGAECRKAEDSETHWRLRQWSEAA